MTSLIDSLVMSPSSVLLSLARFPYSRRAVVLVSPFAISGSSVSAVELVMLSASLTSMLGSLIALLNTIVKLPVCEKSSTLANNGSSARSIVSLSSSAGSSLVVKSFPVSSSVSDSLLSLSSIVVYPSASSSSRLSSCATVSSSAMAPATTRLTSVVLTRLVIRSVSVTIKLY